MLRNDGGQDLREYLIGIAARLLGERGSAGVAVRDIAREARVADGALYNYFEDKEDLLAHALLVHVATVMASAPEMPPAGSGTLAENLEFFIGRGVDVLTRVTPAFAGVLSQPKVLTRFHAMVGGDAAFSPSAPAAGGQGSEASGAPGAGENDRRGLPAILTDYLRAEQRLGRIDAAADISAAATLIVGAIHGEVLPRVLFAPPGSLVGTPPGFARRLAETALSGIAAKSPRL